jgi:hypothetical protein
METSSPSVIFDENNNIRYGSKRWIFKYLLKARSKKRSKRSKSELRTENVMCRNIESKVPKKSDYLNCDL